jgi:hypothetical protein
MDNQPTNAYEIGEYHNNHNKRKTIHDYLTYVPCERN